MFDSTDIVFKIFNTDLIQRIPISDISVFSILCGVLAGGVFMIDWIACYITGSKSLLKLQYTGKQTAIVAFLWILGATGVGAISAFSEVININRNAVLAIGCSWPIIFTKLIKSTNLQKPSKKELDESEAEQ